MRGVLIKENIDMKKGIIWECYKQLYANNFVNLDGKDTSLKKIPFTKNAPKGNRRYEGKWNKIEYLGINITKILKTFWWRMLYKFISVTIK